MAAEIYGIIYFGFTFVLLLSKIAAFPEINLVVILTSNLYASTKEHLQTKKILSDYIIPSVEIK